MSCDNYIVYKNDLKFKKNRKIDDEKAQYDDDAINYKNINMDSYSYRIHECEKNNYLLLDLSGIGLNGIPNVDKEPNSDKIKNIKYLFLNDNNIFDLTGLKQFLFIEVLDISNNVIKEINYLPNTIVELVCHNNNIQSIVEHKKIIKLDCSNNNISILYEYPNLTDLLCNDNKLTRLRSYDKVLRIVCKNNPITNIDKQQKIEKLDCSNTNIIGTLYNHPNLKFLICNSTKINDVSNLISLEMVEFVDTDITKLNFSHKLKQILFKNTQNIKLSSNFKVKNYVKEIDHIFVIFE